MNEKEYFLKELYQEYKWIQDKSKTARQQGQEFLTKLKQLDRHKSYIYKLFLKNLELY